MSTDMLSWDETVKEVAAEKEFPTLPVKIGRKTFQVAYPSKSVVLQINAAMMVNDLDSCVEALYGVEAGAKLVELSNDKPIDMLERFVTKTLHQFGMTGLDGSRPDVDGVGKASSDSGSD